MGAKVDRASDWTDVTGGELHGIDVDLNHIPDAAMTIAAMALFAKGQTVIRNIYNWRVKETDRMHAMAEGLTRLGAIVQTTEDSVGKIHVSKVIKLTNEKYGHVACQNIKNFDQTPSDQKGVVQNSFAFFFSKKKKQIWK